MQVQSMSQMRRWCRQCGLPSPAMMSGCGHCGSVVMPPPARTLRDLVMNSGENVQTNVTNIENVGIYEESEEPVYSESFGHRFLMTLLGLTAASALIVFILAAVILIGLVFFGTMDAVAGMRG
jgi:hypothetical protein